ncbi:MAG: peroxidase-related enzyme [Alphaproteobacteria bacterium]
MAAWIKMIGDKDASPDLLDALDAARAPSGTVGNVMRVHSLRPNTMRGHQTLYKAALHDDANTVPMWLQEVIASYTSILNDCAYSLTNHWANAAHLIGDKDRAAAIRAALDSDRPEDAFDGAELAALRYARKLTVSPGGMEKADVDALRNAGYDDGEILEINQVCAYFNYANRLLNGLGVSLEGDIVGYYVGPDEAEAHVYSENRQ